MRIDRMEKLASYLRTVPEEKFFFNSWFGHIDSPNDNPSECGTVACALGWACMIPEFNRDGLKARIPDNFRPWDIVPSFGRSKTPEMAAAKFFQIPLWMAQSLFVYQYTNPDTKKTQWSYPESLAYPNRARITAIDVAKKIECFVQCEKERLAECKRKP